jgi:hypothetical protein
VSVPDDRIGPSTWNLPKLSGRKFVFVPDLNARGRVKN